VAGRDDGGGGLAVRPEVPDGWPARADPAAELADLVPIEPAIGDQDPPLGGGAATEFPDSRISGVTPDLSVLSMYVDEEPTNASARSGFPAPSTMQADVVGPAIPLSHGSREIKVEWGEGAISGGIVLTVENGQTGVPLGDSGFKMLESTASVKLNGFARRLETSLMTGEFDAEVFEGFSLAFETNLATLGVEGDELEADLLSFSVKVVGDATKLIGAPAGTTVSLDGRLTFSLGGKLAAKLASFAAAQAEQKLLLKQMAGLTGELDDHAKQLKASKKELEALEKAGKKLYPEAGKLRKAIQVQEANLANKSHKLKQFGNKLGGAKRKAAEAITKVRGKIAKKIAQAMEKKAVMMAAKSLAKLVPVLNIVSTIIDVAEIVGLIGRLISGDHGGTGGDEDEKEEKAKDAASDAASDDADAADHDASETDAGTVPKADEPKPGDLSPAATAILDAVTKKGSGSQLDVDQRVMIGLLVPPDLTPQEVAAVIAELTGSTATTTSPEDVIAAIDSAVRSVRDRTRNQAIMVNGVPAPTAADADANDDTTTTDGEPGGMATVTDQTPAPTGTNDEGPITSPRQVATALDIVRSGDPSVIRTWFELKGDALAMSAAGRAWTSAHAKSEIAPNIKLDLVKPSIQSTDAGVWDLSLTFQVVDNGKTKNLTHRYFVKIKGRDGVATGSIGELSFDQYTLIEL